MIFDRIFFLFIFLLFIPLAIYIPNPGGIGLSLPFNLLVYGGAVLLMGVCWRATPLHRVVITPTCRAIFVACSVLALPVIFTRSEWQSAAVWRVTGLFAGAAFYFTWLQVRMTARQRHAVLYLILSAAVVQVLIVLLQLFAPQVAQFWVPANGGRAMGIFQQPNVTASFIATGSALALAAFVLPGFQLSMLRAERWRRRALAAVLVLLPMVLVWLQSRTGWLAGVLVLGAVLLCFGRRHPRAVTIASVLVVGGVIAAAMVLWLGSDMRYTSHTGSNQARFAMLSSTLAMIAEKPLFGWGYGGFEYSFQHFRLAQGLSTHGVGIARHPHNELLLWWVEGGIVALLGMLLLVWAGLKLVACAHWHDKRAFACGKATSGEALALCIALLPIVLHCQTEYPFYLSALHWLVFLMLLAMLDRLVSPRLGKGGTLKRWKYPMLLVSLSGLAVAAAGLYCGQILTQAERSGLQKMRHVEAMPAWVSWTQAERVQFDRQLATLMTFNFSQEEQLLESYAQWAQAYLNRRIDKNVYANLLVILYRQQQYVRADELRREAALLFPFDRRFERRGF
ncbi:O-antigen ligase C-terminal domain-containing protein [Serratia ureilytica]|uniref:PglL family O-oligosaccharyltransferase n=1 Tax=Serratia ureilytica TaxID=300181 RepID=UPI0018D8CCAE|nr:Wzy polymerase domain-containing protein [Serratia ureilytica]MBH3319509.1 O-antigen ligase C-terminal domain-containing protein [Serratia ureilytica]